MHVHTGVCVCICVGSEEEGREPGTRDSLPLHSRPVGQESQCSKYVRVKNQNTNVNSTILSLTFGVFLSPLAGLRLQKPWWYF